jgi:uncharacterized membrane-anchored protein
MKNLLLAFALTILAVNLCAQTEKISYKNVAGKFEKFYNNAQYDSVFALFDPEMAAALPKDKTSEFLSSLQIQVGQIKKREFVRYENTTYGSYKTTFERAILTLNISIDNNSMINGLFVKPYTDSSLPKMERNITKMILPFKGEWTVIWGGDTKELNYHIDNIAQKNAFDFIMMDNQGKSYKTDGTTNEDYYAFGKELIAPCDGEVVLVVDGVKDNIPGEMNAIWIPGNTVIIKTANNEYLFFAHFKQHSIQVIEGQKVKQGQVLGLCGNSGNSSEAHLHFHLQNVENMNVATGIKCYFDNLKVNGELKTNYSPIKKDRIKDE